MRELNIEEVQVVSGGRWWQDPSLGGGYTWIGDDDAAPAQNTPRPTLIQLRSQREQVADNSVM